MMPFVHKTKPAQPERFQKRLNHIREDHALTFVPAAMAWEAGLLLEAYHGSYIKAGWHLLWWGTWSAIVDSYWRAIFWFTDKVGWTKLYPMPAWPGTFMRHGGKCKYLNCSDMDCIDKSVPKWFRKLTRWHE